MFRRTLFVKRNFIMHSGEETEWKAECNALTNKDIETLAFMISEKISFAAVIGIPRGGVRLAKALDRYAVPRENNILIVDDVFTTGKSMEKMRSDVLTIYPNTEINGVVIFARRKCPDWVSSVWQYRL